jgi:GTP-binding protein Era
MRSASTTSAEVRSGIVAVVGRPNVGKSTLVNALVGRKVAIVSDKPQTTRRGVRGIVTDDVSQLVLVDTPGFHKPRTALGARLNEIVGQSTDGVDAIVHVVDAASGVGRGDAFVYERRVAPHAVPKLCAVNKIDAVRGRREVPQLQAASELGAFDEIVPTSARTGAGVETLKELLVALLPEGPPLYPPGEFTDAPIEERLAEIVREKALAVAREEVPHSIAVRVDDVERDGDLTKIAATIVVERDSQKGILIGRGGETLKTIGTRAREEMEAVLGTRVFLEQRVTVLREWQRDPKALRRLGFG